VCSMSSATSHLTGPPSRAISSLVDWVSGDEAAIQRSPEAVLMTVDRPPLEGPQQLLGQKLASLSRPAERQTYMGTRPKRLVRARRAGCGASATMKSESSSFRRT
jgi:hypothetical protein